MPWTSEREAELKAHVESGLTAGEISRLMYTTRNAVIGKLHRLGVKLKRPASYNVRPKIAKPKPPPAPKVPKKPPRPFVWSNGKRHDPLFVPANTTIETLDILCENLETYHCRWPYQKNDNGPWFFCGQPSVPGLSWCVGHCHIVYEG